jgi:hypothetical protein
MKSNNFVRDLGSGTVVALGLAGVAVLLLALGRVVGWDATWRAFGVTPPQPPFFDMHVINDYAVCAWKGVDAYAPHACNGDNFNIPPIWLWLGFLGIDGADSSWLSAAIIAATSIVLVLLFRGRSRYHGLIALTRDHFAFGDDGRRARQSRPPHPGARGTGRSDLPRDENQTRLRLSRGPLPWRHVETNPDVLRSLAARFSRQTFIFACTLAAFSLLYLSLALPYILLIRQNVPTTFVLSYGYKAIFLGIDHIRSEAGLGPIGLADTWLPASTAAVVLACAALVAVRSLRHRREFCSADTSVAGTAFLFGAGIYCGTFLLGTNFIYR